MTMNKSPDTNRFFFCWRLVKRHVTANGICVTSQIMKDDIVQVALYSQAIRVSYLFVFAVVRCHHTIHIMTYFGAYPF